MLPSRAMILSRSIVSVLPTMSSRKTGLYFSTLPPGVSDLTLQGWNHGATHHGNSYAGLPLGFAVAAL
jgi:hypothetical protein